MEPAGGKPRHPWQTQRPIMERRLTVEEVRMLAEVERKMDSGEIKFVRLRQHRISVLPEVMTELGLMQGQTITDAIYGAILEQNLAYCQTQSALQRAAVAASES